MMVAIVSPSGSETGGNNGEGSSPRPSGPNNEGTIRVALRFRPILAKEKQRARTNKKRVKKTLINAKCDQSDGSGWEFNTARRGGPCCSVSQKGAEKPVDGQSQFAYDDIFHGGTSTMPAATTEDVYGATCRPVVDGVLDGVDGTIFAYGQTGSGKTWTMQGKGATAGADDDDDDPDNDGIVQMASKSLFSYIDAHPEREFLIRSSYVEIYNEHIIDLLPNKSPPPEVTVREDPKSRGGINISAAEVLITDHKSLVEALVLGNANRSVGSTSMNEQSSRSHAIFRITVESREVMGTDEDDEESADDRAVLVSTLNLVDLAGSESVRGTGASGARQKEGGKINRSLLALSNVIHSLSQPPSKRPKYINYRDSKLTRILQPSLSGNARTAVLCCASPSPAYIEETRSTLKFASRAKLVHVHAKKNEVMDDRALIKRLQRELAAAKKALREAEDRERKHVVATDESQSADNMREKLVKLESIILSPKGKGLNRANKPLAASLDPALWRRTNSPLKNGRPNLTYSVVDMPLGLEALQVIEEDETNDEIPGLGSHVGSSNGLTSETDILKEALKKKSETNRALNDELEQLNAKIASLQAEVKLSKEESNAYKAERDTLAATTHSTQSNNVYESDGDIDCLLPARRTFWQILFGRNQNLLECCKFS